MIAFPTNEDLEPMVNEATVDKTIVEFISNQLNNIQSLVSKDLRSYRSYGVYWWPIKKMLIDNGVTKFGPNLAKDIILLTSNLSNESILCAAYANKIVAIENGKIYSSNHMYDSLNEDGIEEYNVDDIDMESLIAM